MIRTKKGELNMLQFLQTGKVLYVLAAVCGLGAVSKLVTSSLYKRLIKETGNIALTKNRNLKALKQKTENMFLLSHGIRNPGAYIEKQIYGFRFLGMTLDSWDNLSVQAMITCFLIGGIAAFGAYWYRCDSYYIVMYGTMGILGGLLLVLVDNGANISLKRQQLTDDLVDYVENSPHFYKAMEQGSDSMGLDRKGKPISVSPRSRLRGMGLRNDRAAEEAAAAFDTVSEKEKPVDKKGTGVFPASRERAEGENGKEKTDRQTGRFSVLAKKKDRREPVIRSVSVGGRNDENESEKDRPAESGEDELTKSIDYLKQSLEQIAASREQNKRELQSARGSDQGTAERVKRELKPEDLKLLGEILQEYLT